MGSLLLSLYLMLISALAMGWGPRMWTCLLVLLLSWIMVCTMSIIVSLNTNTALRIRLKCCSMEQSLLLRLYRWLLMIPSEGRIKTSLLIRCQHSLISVWIRMIILFGLT